MQCQRVSTRVGPTVHPGLGNTYDARCSHDAVAPFNGEHLCRRHINLAKRDKLIAEYIYKQGIHCPYHQDRRLRTGGRGTLLFCSARMDTGPSWSRDKQYCSFKHDLPQSLLDAIQRLIERKG